MSNRCHFSRQTATDISYAATFKLLDDHTFVPDQKHCQADEERVQSFVGSNPLAVK